jgi:DNA-binding winged helix-turn-helix (wHTH) protein/TolB-like protein/tetratricopeptide (TPR) repeat protein
MNFDMDRTGTRQFGQFCLDIGETVLRHAGEIVPLSPKEMEILCLLANEPGRLVTKDEIVERVWNDSFVEESNLSRQIYMLRKRLGDLGAPRDLIQNVPRRGYRFKVSVLGSGHETVIEKHIFTQTVFEEIEGNGEFAEPETLPSSVSPVNRVRTLVLAVTVSLLAVAGLSFATWQFRATSGDSTKPGSMAVIPFKVIGTGDESTGAAIADLLITRLSSLPNLKVRPTTAVIDFDFSVSSVDFGKSLGVDAVLEGTVLRSAEGHRVTARLIDVRDGNTIWSGEFAADGGTVLSLHDDIADGMLAAMSAGQPRESGKPQQPLTKSEVAFRYYAKARHQWNRRDTEGMQQAASLFRRAIEADPDFVLAKVGLAETLMMGYQHEQASRLLNEAEAADPSRGQIFAAKGFIELFHHWEWNSAENNLKRAIELNPGHPSAYQWYATLLSITGRHEEAKAKMQMALEIDPVSPNLIADLGQMHYFAGELDAAERLAKDALSIAPNFAMARFLLADIYFYRAETDQWANQFVTASNSLGLKTVKPVKGSDGPFSSAAKITAYKSGGVAALDDLLLRESEFDTNANRFIGRARIFVRRGEPEKAINSLEQALSGGAFLMPFVKNDPIFEPLRQDARFRQLMRQMGL